MPFQLGPDGTLGQHHPTAKYKIKPMGAGAKPSIYAIRWATDGKLLASAIDDGRIRIYDGATGRTKCSLVDESPHSIADTSNVPRFSLYSSASTSSSSRTASQPTIDGGTSTFKGMDGSEADIAAHKASQAEKANKGINAATIALRFCPAMQATTDSTQYTLLSASSSGTVRHWKIAQFDGDSGDADPAPECTHETHLGNDAVAFCLDYNARGTSFAAGCKDAVVRVYDEETRTLKQTLDGGGGKEFEGHSVVREMCSADYALKVINQNNAAKAVTALNKEMREVTRHSNRIYSVKFTCGFSSHVDNLIVSAGWDRTMQVWDLRAPGPPVKSYFGVYLAGDALDCVDCDILTASFRPTAQLQLWDLRSGAEPREVLAFNDGKPHELYSAQFSGNRDVGSHFNIPSPENERTCFVAAGGLGDSSLSILDHTREDAVACVIDDLPGGIVSLDFCPSIYLPPPGFGTPTKATLDTAPASNEKKSKFAHLKDTSQAPGGRNKESQHNTGTRLAIACKNGLIRVVDICRTKALDFTFAPVDEEEVEDGDEGEDGAVVSLGLSLTSLGGGAGGGAAMASAGGGVGLGSGLAGGGASRASAGGGARTPKAAAATGRSPAAQTASRTKPLTLSTLSVGMDSPDLKSIPGMGLSPSWSDSESPARTSALMPALTPLAPLGSSQSDSSLLPSTSEVLAAEEERKREAADMAEALKGIMHSASAPVLSVAEMVDNALR